MAFLYLYENFGEEYSSPVCDVILLDQEPLVCGSLQNEEYEQDEI